MNRVRVDYLHLVLLLSVVPMAMLAVSLGDALGVEVNGTVAGFGAFVVLIITAGLFRAPFTQHRYDRPSAERFNAVKENVERILRLDLSSDTARKERGRFVRRVLRNLDDEIELVIRRFRGDPSADQPSTTLARALTHHFREADWLECEVLASEIWERGNRGIRGHSLDQAICADAALYRLSVIARLAIGLSCFERYCQHIGLTNSEVDAFLDYLWRLPVTAFCEWDEEHPDLLYVATEPEPDPDGLSDALLELGIEITEFIQAAEDTAEIAMTNASGNSTNDWTVECTQRMIHRMRVAGLPEPDLAQYSDALWQDEHGWGKRVTERQLDAWRYETTWVEAAVRERPS